MAKLKLIIRFFSIFFLFFMYPSIVQADTEFPQRPDVQQFIQSMTNKHHFSPIELNALFSQVTIRPKVVQSVKKPAELLPWYVYERILISPSHIENGVKFWQKHKAVLSHVEKKYGVPASIIVATIGVETKYGTNKGSYPVMDALTNIAFSDSPRAPFFKSELEEFLLLSREQHWNPTTVLGSYAGAMGQPQFMPSSVRHYAVSYNGSKTIDLTNNVADVIASIANYYKKKGWETHKQVAILAHLTQKYYGAAVQRVALKPIFSFAELKDYGINPSATFPKDQPLLIIALQKQTEIEYWIGLHNFTIIKRYNPSNLYAMAVFQLSQLITSAERKGGHHA